MKTTLGNLVFATVAGFGVATSAVADTLIIGHFGDPTPMNVAAAEGRFADATGWDIEWRKFASGTDVIAALASGDVMVSELGSSPLAIAVSQGVDIELVLISFGIGTAESLIVRDDSGIAEPADLKGKRVAVPVGSTAHFSLMGALRHWGIGENEVRIMSMPPDQINAAWTQSAIDAAFIWEPVQSSILATGTRMVGADEIATWGYPTFNGWVVSRQFAAENPDAVTAFVRTMNEANAAYLENKDAWTTDSAPVQAIAERTGAAPEQVPTILEGFTFLTPAEQVSDAWLGGTAARALKETAEFLKEAGRIDTVVDDYSQFVNARFAEAVAD